MGWNINVKKSGLTTRFLKSAKILALDVECNGLRWDENNNLEWV